MTFFRLTYFFLFVGISSISGMLIPFLQYKGFKPIQVGSLISVFTFMGIIGQLCVGYFCDKFKTIKNVLIFSLLMTFINGILSIIIPKGIYFYISFFILGLFIYILASLVDSWVLESEVKNSFGKLRSIGSFGWAIGVLITGYIVSIFGYKFINILFGICILSTIFVVSKLKDVNKKEAKKVHIKCLIKNRSYDFLVLSLLFVCISYRSYIQIVPYFIEYIGKSASSVGNYYFLASIMEIIMLMFCAKIMHKISPDKLLIITPIALLFQLSIMYFMPNIIFLYISSIFNIFTFPVILMVGRIMVDRVCCNELKTTSQLIGFAIYNSLGIMISSFGVGFLVSNFGVKQSLLILIGFTIFSLVVTIFYDRKVIDELLD